MQQLDQLTAGSDALLDYSLSTAPAPVQVSRSASDPSHATLTFVISNPGADVEVTQIAFDLPVGNPQQPAGPDLTEQPAGIRASVSDSAWQIGAGAAPGSFVMKPASGQPITVGDQGIAVTLAQIEVSTVVGTAEVTIVEQAQSAAGGQPLTSRTSTLAVAKFPYGFYAGNLALAQPLIAHGATATLSWIGSDAPGTTYTMLWAQQSTDVTSVRSWTSPALTDTTTFILEVQTTGPDGPVKVWFSATEIVSDPSIVATDLTVLTTSALQGAASVGTPAAPANLTVNGGVAAGGATVTGTATVGSLTTGGKVQAASVATGPLTANGSTLTNTTLAGLLTATGSTVSMLGAAQTVTPQSYTANTDGFVLGFVPGPSNVQNLCLTVVTCSVQGGAMVRMTGGTVMQVDSNGNYYTSTDQSTLLVPVQRGATWNVSVWQGPYNQESVTPSFWWIPLGTPPGEGRYLEVVAWEPPAIATQLTVRRDG